MQYTHFAIDSIICLFGYSVCIRSIVISDIHLGIDYRIAENVKNRPLLIAFLDSIREKDNGFEIVPVKGKYVQIE